MANEISREIDHSNSRNRGAAQDRRDISEDALGLCPAQTANNFVAE